MLKIITRNAKISFIIILGIFMLHAYSDAEAKRIMKPVDSSQVCMVNNEVMGKAQIPVPFEGKTYYGCCEGCVEKLKTNRAMRYAKDPLTGKEVDKAKAVIIKGAGGEALYFESLGNAKAYNSSKKLD